MSYSNTIKSITIFDSGDSTAKTESIRVPSGATSIGLLIQSLTGNTTGMILGVEVSNNGITWYESAYTSGVIGKNGNTCLALEHFPYDYMRIVTKTRSSVASTIKIIAVGR